MNHIVSFTPQRVIRTKELVSGGEENKSTSELSITPLSISNKATQRLAQPFGQVMERWAEIPQQKRALQKRALSYRA